jgi:hypothetical protein
LEEPKATNCSTKERAAVDLLFWHLLLASVLTRASAVSWCWKLGTLNFRRRASSDDFLHLQVSDIGDVWFKYRRPGNLHLLHHQADDDPDGVSQPSGMVSFHGGQAFSSTSSLSLLCCFCHDSVQVKPSRLSVALNPIFSCLETSHKY